jgi:hypothetical protein
MRERWRREHGGNAGEGSTVVSVRVRGTGGARGWEAGAGSGSRHPWGWEQISASKVSACMETESSMAGVWPFCF